MGAYMYPITVKKDKQIIRYIERHVLPDRLLDLSDIQKHIKEGDKFSITEIEQGVFCIETVLTVHKMRLETDEELNLRVNKELSYMAEYNKRQNK